MKYILLLLFLKDFYRFVRWPRGLPEEVGLTPGPAEAGEDLFGDDQRGRGPNQNVERMHGLKIKTSKFK